MLLTVFASLKPCVAALEACAGAHHWGREIAKLGHNVRLIAQAAFRSRWTLQPHAQVRAR
jgi:transposase